MDIPQPPSPHSVIEILSSIVFDQLQETSTSATDGKDSKVQNKKVVSTDLANEAQRQIDKCVGAL